MEGSTLLAFKRLSPWLLGASLACCGGAPARSTAPLRPEQASLFENGIDWITAPTALQGQWKTEWYNELDQRVQHADVIADCKIRTLRTDIDHDQRVVHRMSIRLSKVYQGEVDADDLELAVSDHQAGFPSVDQGKERILDRRFVAFVRWAKDTDGQVRPHYHLGAASPEVLAEVKKRVAYAQALLDDGSQR